MYDKEILNKIVFNSVRVYKRDLESTITSVFTLGETEYLYDADTYPDLEGRTRRQKRHIQVCDKILLSKELKIFFPGEDGIFKPTLGNFLAKCLWTYERYFRNFIDSFPDDEDPELKYQFIEKNFGTREESKVIEIIYFLLGCRYNMVS